MQRVGQVWRHKDRVFMVMSSTLREAPDLMWAHDVVFLSHEDLRRVGVTAQLVETVDEDMFAALLTLVALPLA